MSTIAVSVTTYDYAKYLPQCLDSILSQTKKANEIFVVDDASMDNTQKIIKKYKNKVNYIRFDKNYGIVCKTYNEGLKRAKSDYLLWISADDWLHPKMLEKEARVLDQNPDIGMVYAQAYDVVNNKKQLIIHPGSGNNNYKRRNNEFELLLTKGNYIPCLTALVRKKVYEDVGYFDEYFNLMGDYEMWIRIAKKYPVAYLAQPLAYYRLHEKNLHLDPKRQKREEVEWGFILKKHLKKDNNLSKKAYYYYYLTQSSKSFENKRLKRALKLWQKGILQMPLYIPKLSTWQPFYFFLKSRLR